MTVSLYIASYVFISCMIVFETRLVKCNSYSCYYIRVLLKGFIYDALIYEGYPIIYIL